MMGGGTRQAMFAGTEPAPIHLALDTERVSSFLSARVEGFRGLKQVLKFKDRSSGASRSLLLRRRERSRVRVLSDGFVDGRVFWDAELPGETPQLRTVLYEEMNRLFARLHRFDHMAAGLADFGKTGSYAARNLARWSKVYQQSKLVDIPNMEWLIDALHARLPGNEQTPLLHGDYGLYNIIVHPAKPEILAVLDSEMSTLGDPFIDLAHHLRPWWESPDSRQARRASSAAILPASEFPAWMNTSRDIVNEWDWRRSRIGLSTWRSPSFVMQR